MTGAYVQVIPSAETVDLIRRVTRGVSLPLYPNSELHCTVMYCAQSLPNSDFLVEKCEHMCEKGPFTAYAERAEIWDSQGGSKIVVLRLRSSALNSRHEFWRQQGLNPTFPVYNPHVTLCDNVKDPEQLRMLTKTVEVINMMIRAFIGNTPLTFRKEVMTPTKPEKARKSAQPRQPQEVVTAAKKKKKKGGKKSTMPGLRQLTGVAPLGDPGLHPPGLDESEELSVQKNGFNAESHKRLLDGLGKI